VTFHNALTHQKSALSKEKNLSYVKQKKLKNNKNEDPKFRVCLKHM